jgi:1,4-dihydroxy-2-naphthoyl-CoA synthase
MSIYEDIKIKDAYGNHVVIQITNSINLKIEDQFDCVSLSARYDHGFGFSQLFRFVQDKESKEIEAICDLVNVTSTPKLLPINASKKWRVLVTPVIKSNNNKNTDIYRELMLSIIKEMQSIQGASILFSQYSLMLSYKIHQFDGIIKALNELKLVSFKKIHTIRFEVDSRYSNKVRDQFAKGLLN